MTGLEPWWLDLWVFMASLMAVFAGVLASIGCGLVLFEGRKAWTRELTGTILFLLGFGLFFPLVIVVAVLVFIYRVVTGE